MPAGSDVPLCEAAAEGRVSDVEELLKEEDGRSGAAEIKRVLVIVAGAAGLAAAVELALEGHDVVVYEKSSEIGGVWNYAPEADSDPLSFDPQRKRVHSSMYASLRTNLPRELMGFLILPFLFLLKKEETSDVIQAMKR